MDHLLRQLPSRDLGLLQLVIFRQPTRKQRVFASVWGRLAYYADVSDDRGGTAIILEAQELGARRWAKSLEPDAQAELERLRADGHAVTADRRGYTLSSTAESLRNTQLYRTVPHEVGHLVDWDRSVLTPSLRATDEDGEALRTRYDTRPTRQKEDFAHRYADETQARLRAKGSVPFAPIHDEASMRRDGLDPRWFVPVGKA